VRSPWRPGGSIIADVQADPAEWHRSGTTPRAGIPRWPHTGGETNRSLQIPRDARPTHLSSFRLLTMASPQLDTRQKILIWQHTSGIMRVADSRYKVSQKKRGILVSGTTRGCQSGQRRRMVQGTSTPVLGDFSRNRSTFWET